MTTRNAQVEARSASVTVADVDTDGNGDVVITVGSLRHIESAADVTASAAGGYVANVQSVSGNDVTVRLFEGGGAATVLSAVTGSADVTDIHVVAQGQ